MDRRDDQPVELLRAYSIDELSERELALVGFYRGDFCSGPLKR